MIGVSVHAQSPDINFDTKCPANSEAACFGVSEVMGLDPNDDGVLAVRRGPGSDCRKIAEIYNGDRVGVFETKRDWQAISYGSDNRFGWVQRLIDHL